ncbi:SDR family oxidoreductase [Azospirillum thermophilum]|uniref:NAD(P)-dependent oxidoreductase n=1 Tax=Azospirillum thermophilum TaxID=2202148 RepID=A0A2S2CX03_9PROT|nr:SDR family oxidoreductase [Azospirillum thermophilum]AWK89016.1 NAD(P)-dependent oxidoreductase [Azospirillum thermophilum]
MSTPSFPTLLVTGASGHLGQRVLHHLLETLKVPAERIVATTRNPDRLASLAARGVTVRAADFDDRASLAAAFRGVDRLLLISTDVLDRPGHRLAQHKAAVEAAAQAGVGHVVYTSMPGPQTSAVLFAPDHAGTEAALAASGLPGWTVLRNHWYFENIFHALPSILATGQWYAATGNGGLAHIARDDLALAAATALAGKTEGKTVLTLSGARAYTTAELADLIGQTAGRPIQVIQVPVEGLVQGMLGAGLPEPVARVFASFDENTAKGGFGEVTGDFKALTGRDPQPFEAWLEAHRIEIASLAK